MAVLLLLGFIVQGLILGEGFLLQSNQSEVDLLKISLQEEILKRIALETQLNDLQGQLNVFKEQMSVLQDCGADFCGVHWSMWSVWSTWSHCSSDCTAGVGSRTQSRSRQRTCLQTDPQTDRSVCKGTASETDTRPCNAVEYYGCINPNTTGGDSDLYGIAYNFYDELAQSICTSAATKPTHVDAVRRGCETGHAPTCNQICASLGFTCFDAIHTYKGRPLLKPNTGVQTDVGKVGLETFRYFAASGCNYANSCGPNYCCCSHP